MSKKHLTNEELSRLKKEVEILKRENEKEELGLREGQMWMLSLFKVNKKVYNSITGTSVDPFYNSKWVPSFLDAIDPKNSRILIPAIYYYLGVKLDWHFQPANCSEGITLTGTTWEGIKELANGILPLYISNELKLKEGFLTVSNEFLTKVEAARRAYNCNQIQELKPELTPSDLL